MQNNTFENLRNHYKPDNVEVLFVGESRPQRGAFFYQEDSSLYRETKKAFNEYFAQDIFTIDNFKQWGCWLYDICENPVNNLSTYERRHLIRQNIPRLENIIKQEFPKIIIICKKTLLEPEIRESGIMNILGSMSIGGTITKVEELANTLQVCFDAGAKKILIPMASAADLSTVPSELFAKFQISFYQSAEDAVFKALGVE